MISYQQSYRPAYAKLSQAPANVPPPAPDFLFTGYMGIPGIVESVLVLGVSGAAAWVGIRTALTEKKNDYLKAAGWIGGVGSVIIGLLYLGAKSGYGQIVGLPAVRVSPT